MDAIWFVSSGSQDAASSPLWTIVLSGLGAALIALIAAIIASFIAHNTKVSEFRQAWIDGLRIDIAAYLGLAHRWIRVWEDVQTTHSEHERARLEEERAFPISNEARVLLWRIRLRINPRPNRFKADDDALIQQLSDLLDPGKPMPDKTDRVGTGWDELAEKAVLHSQEVLKREWQVAKHPIRAAIQKTFSRGA